jgi:predicted ATPase
VQAQSGYLEAKKIDTLISYLNNKELLLIIDNCEHLINECADLTEKLLVSSSKLKIISTSREVLNCSGEQSYKIPMLSVPDNLNDHSIEDLYKFEASQLFIERAYSVNSDFKLNESNFKALAEICRHPGWNTTGSGACRSQYKIFIYRKY